MPGIHQPMEQTMDSVSVDPDPPAAQKLEVKAFYKVLKPNSTHWIMVKTSSSDSAIVNASNRFSVTIANSA